MDERAIDELVRGFEEGTWPGREWKHWHHLAVATCYVLQGEDALDRLRAGIPRPVSGIG
jgi:hypothetical protein